MRAVLRVVGAFLFGFLLLVGSLYLYFFRFGGLEEVVNAQLATLVERRHNLDITVGKISGDLLSGVVLENVSVFYVDSIYYYLLADVPRISAAYSITNLWDRRYIFDYVVLDSVSITIKRDSTGRWVVPGFSSRTGGQPRSVPAFAIEDLVINDAGFTLVQHQDTLVVRDVSLNASVEGRAKTYAIDLKRLTFSSERQDIAVTAAQGKVTYSDGIVVSEGVDIIEKRTRLRLDGTVKLKDVLSGQMDFSVDNLNLTEVSGYLGISVRGVVDATGSVQFADNIYRGSLTLAGELAPFTFKNLFSQFTLSGTELTFDTLYGAVLGRCTIDGRGDIDLSAKPERYSFEGEIRNFDLSRLIENGMESDLSGRLELSGESFSTDDIVLDIHTEVYESSFDEYPIHAASGRMRVTGDSVTFADGFRIGYYENVFYVSGRLDYSKDVNLRVVADLNNLDHYQGKFFIDQPGGRGSLEATISGNTADPDLRGLFTSDSVWIYDLFSSDLAMSVEVSRFLTGRRGAVDVLCFDGTAWGQPYDSGYMHFTIDSNVVRVDAFHMHNDYAQLDAAARLDYEADPLSMIIDSLQFTIFDQTFFNRSSVQLEIDSLGFSFVRAEIGNRDAHLSLAGRLNFDESMQARLWVDQVPIKPWVGLFDTAVAVDGSVSCEALIGGTFLRPVITLTGSVDSLAYRDLVLGTLIAGLHYQDRLLTLDSLHMVSTDGRYRAVGTFHMDLAFSSTVVERFPDLPMDLMLSASDHRFDLVSLIMPSVEELDGDFFANVRLSGTPHAPHLQGEAYIKDARLKYFDLQQPINADSAGVTMADNRIIINRIDAYVVDKKRGHRKREARIEGEIIVKSLDNFYYDVYVILPKEFPFTYELDDITGVVEGELHVEGETPPLVTGDLTITSMKYLVNFADEGEGSPVMQALAGENTWDLNINIDVLSNYWIKNDDIDAEFSGQLNLIRDQGVYRFIGEMEIVRGRGFLFDKTFRLESGSQVIFEGNPTINPRLDIIGYTRIAGLQYASDDEFETSKSLELGIHVTGTLEKPEINPVAGSDLSREDILPLLLANYYSSDAVSSSGVVQQRIAGLVSTQLSQIGTRHLGQLGVETFEIDPTYGQDRGLLKARVTVGAYAAPNLYVYGRSTLSGQTQQAVGFEYRFSRTVLLEGLRDEKELYHLAVKLHWEF